MGNLGNIAMFWCKIKGYIMLFLAFIFGVFLIKGLMTITSSKKQADRDNAIEGVFICAIFVSMFTLFYFLLKTDIGCGVSIAGNVYQLVR